MARTRHPGSTGLETAAADWRTRSFWMATAPYEPTPPLEGDARADIVIVGGGYTGLHAAIALKEANPGIDVAVLDAGVCGYGASARNGGFCMTMLDRGLVELAHDVGDADARESYTAVAAAIDQLERFCDAESIAADLRHTGILTVSNGPSQDRSIAAEYETAQRLGLPGFRYLSGDEIRAEIRTEWFRCAVAEDTCRLVNPAKLAWGLRDAARRRGVRVHEFSPVDALDTASSGPVTARTPRGRVVADRGLIATNAYTSALPQLRRYLMTFYAYIIVTEPLTDAQWKRIGWDSRAGVEDRRVFHHYARPTVDGRILWGGRDAPHCRGEPNPAYDRHYPNFGRLEETFRLAFPQLDDVRFEYRWGGPIDGTTRFLPFVAWAGEGRRFLYAAGYTGHGVGPSALIGGICADLLTGRHTGRTELIFTRKRPLAMPREPLRSWIINGSSRVLQRADDRTTGGLAGRLLNAASKILS